MNKRLLTDEQLYQVCEKYRPDFVNFSEARAVAKAQDTKTAAAKDAEWAEDMDLHEQNIRNLERLKCQARVERIFMEIEASAVTVDVFDEDGSVVCRKGDIILLQGWWLTLKAKYLEGGE